MSTEARTASWSAVQGQSGSCRPGVIHLCLVFAGEGMELVPHTVVVEVL